MDIDIRDGFGRKKLCLITKEIWYIDQDQDLVVQTNDSVS